MISRIVDCELPINQANLEGKNVLVTGGADGVGAGLVRALANAGASVTIGDVNASKGLALAEELKDKDLRAQFVEFDVTQWQSQVNGFKSATAFGRNGSLDMVYLNAGVAEPSILGNIANATEPSTEPINPSLKVFDVNLQGVVQGISLAVHHFNAARPAPSTTQTQERKSIVLTGSLASYLASPNSETYGASKFAVRGLFKSMRETLPKMGIRINMIAPTYIRTAMVAPVVDKVESQGIRITEVSMVVEAMMRLACDSSINGRSIGVGPDRCFDYGDDFAGHDGFFALKAFLETGALGPKHLEALQLMESKD